MWVTNLGPAVAGDAAAAGLADAPALPPEPVFLPGGGVSGVDAPSNSNLTVPSTTGMGPSVGLRVRCSDLLSSSATSSSTLPSTPMLQSKFRKPPLPAAPR